MSSKYFRTRWAAFLAGPPLLAIFYFIASPYQNCKRIFTEIALENGYSAMSKEHAEICRRKDGWGLGL